MIDKSQKITGKQVIRAGEYLIKDNATTDQAKFEQSMDILSYWRYSHEKSLNLAYSLISKLAFNVDKKAIVAKRLKRQASIVSKLKRFDGMKLKNMQDIGGCRAIVSNKKKVSQLLREAKARIGAFSNKQRRVRDYISNPKCDGYRGIHLTAFFEDAIDGERAIEIQLRTFIQHLWATSVEIVDLYTGQALKSNQGDAEWAEFFRLIGNQFAIMEDIHRFDLMPLYEKASNYYNVVYKNQIALQEISRIKQLYLSQAVNVKFEAFKHALKIAEKQIKIQRNADYVLLEIDTIRKQVEWIVFSSESSGSAQKMYIEKEKTNSTKPGIVIALVSSTAVGGIQEAYPNYFADSDKFMELVEIVNKTPLIYHSPTQIRRKLVIEI